MKSWLLIMASLLSGIISFGRGVEDSKKKHIISDTLKTLSINAKFIKVFNPPLCSCFGQSVPERNVFEIEPSYQSGWMRKRIIVEYPGCNRNGLIVGKVYKIIAKEANINGWYENIATISAFKQQPLF